MIVMRRNSFFLLCLVLLTAAFARPLMAAQKGMLQTNDIRIVFDPGLRGLAGEVAQDYPQIREELEKRLQWRLNFRPTVALLKSSSTFQRLAGSRRVVAFAVPQKQLVVIDHARMHRPFSVRTTLKHELCHLLLHHHIGDTHLPKWLDEGVCQWISDGMAEILMDSEQKALREASLSGNYLSLSTLEASFPNNQELLPLAYQQSKSLVDYINREHGKMALLNILEHLKEGDQIEVAVQKALSISLPDLEARWHQHLQDKPGWLISLAANLYQLLFFCAALITIWGFVRMIRKKRAFRKETDL